MSELACISLCVLDAVIMTVCVEENLCEHARSHNDMCHVSISHAELASDWK